MRENNENRSENILSLPLFSLFSELFFQPSLSPTRHRSHPALIFLRPPLTAGEDPSHRSYLPAPTSSSVLISHAPASSSRLPLLDFFPSSRTSSSSPLLTQSPTFLLPHRGSPMARAICSFQLTEAPSSWLSWLLPRRVRSAPPQPHAPEPHFCFSFCSSIHGARPSIS